MLSDFTIDWGINPIMYKHVYFILIGIFVFFSWARYSFALGNENLLKKQSQISITFLVSFLILFIGFRCNNYSDMGGYIMNYLTKRNVGNESFSLHTEWLWARIATICQDLGFSVWMWFAIIALGYIGFMFWTCKRLLWENVPLAMLFMMSSFTFFAYGTNTVRNGLACSFVLFALSFCVNGKKDLIIASILLLAAFGIHRSTIIPIVAIVMSLFLIKKIRWGIIIWVSSVLLSLTVGQSLMGLFSRFNDERVEAYFNNTKNAHLFSSTGFRWDFLLYSAVPVFVAWYVSERKQIDNKVFNFLSNTYILSNSVWVICIRASFSDRFAYLSWFLYPMILAYAFIRLPLHQNQDKTVAWVLLAQLSFTLVMFYVI